MLYSDFSSNSIDEILEDFDPIHNSRRKIIYMGRLFGLQDKEIFEIVTHLETIKRTMPQTMANLDKLDIQSLYDEHQRLTLTQQEIKSRSFRMQVRTEDKVHDKINSFYNVLVTHQAAETSLIEQFSSLMVDVEPDAEEIYAAVAETPAVQQIDCNKLKGQRGRILRFEIGLQGMAAEEIIDELDKKNLPLERQVVLLQDFLKTKGPCSFKNLKDFITIQQGATPLLSKRKEKAQVPPEAAAVSAEAAAEKYSPIIFRAKRQRQHQQARACFLGKRPASTQFLCENSKRLKTGFEL